jgi:hypothetical protein
LAPFDHKPRLCCTSTTHPDDSATLEAIIQLIFCRPARQGHPKKIIKTALHTDGGGR